MKISAGLLMYRIKNNTLEIFLVHPGGPFSKNKDTDAWSIPKGEVNDNEDLLDAAKREFEEEVGFKPIGEFIPLDSIKQKSGKVVHAWAFEGNLPENFELKSNLVEVDVYGKKQSFPEVDKAEFFSVDEAKIKINEAQEEFIERLEKSLKLP